MTISQLIAELEAQERLVGPDAPVEVQAEVEVCCDLCQLNSRESVEAKADAAVIRSGRVLILTGA